ncbi:chemotaxis protein CheB [Desulfonatronovibrio magnus]|uniref:chemotaxis protein CheB n=1 Tax=Desulfonatronovibrio magnus TaxID=698827 RepID=UPI000A5C45A1|nr:chemotaxis protein CheB [Desulfonatronovibrio magnus]
MIEESSETKPSLYVGIGASAGGLEAIETFFSGMDCDTGLAFIVVQHLSPDYKSLMKEILSKKTKMNVNRVEDGMEVQADNIYLIPPKKNLTIYHGRLMLSPQEHAKGIINLPIDIFLRSLAQDQGDKAVSVILSGSGSDGARGVRAVKENGGMVMVQDEESALFSSMPKAAISTGLVDFILHPAEMPDQLTSYSRHPYVAKKQTSSTVSSDEDALNRIFATLRDRFKVDFSHYRPSTLSRRIERRMTINGVDNIRDYLSCLESYSSEPAILFKEFLIGVTRFFRDREAFDSLRQRWLPELFGSSPSKEYRFWCAACSTGEEAYSLAILVKQLTEKMDGRPNIKIFATDIDRDSVQYAAAGIYPESIAADVPPELLKSYFNKRQDSFQICREVREMVVFAQHNLIKDPPFTKIDMLSCRNLLIYLQTSLQRKVLEFFNFSLNPKGLLMLGTSETAGEMGDYFESLDHKNKIYRSKGRVRQTLHSESQHFVPDRADKNFYHRPAYHRSGRSAPDDMILERFIEALTEERIHVAVIINEHLDVLHIIGESNEYFRLPSGRLSMNISKMAVRDLAIPISTGVHRVLRTGKEQSFSNVRLREQAGTKTVNMLIKPLPAQKGQEPLLVIFLDRPQVKKVEKKEHCSSYDLSQEAEQRINDLEQELQFTRENLQATVEELETANEELQATNEELVAGNEELQSTNEELQSTNEELHSVNAEYQSKIIELTELHNDVDNLLSSSQIGKLLLDENLEIRKFSPSVRKIFKLLNTDIGRPITHIGHYLEGVDPCAIIRSVQEKGVKTEQEVCSSDGRWYLMRVVPYGVGPDIFSGTVVSFVDINRLKLTEEALRRNELLLNKTQEISRIGGWEMDVKSGTIVWTDEVYNIYGVSKNYNPSDVEKDMDFYGQEARKKLEKAFDRAVNEGIAYDLELPFTKADSSRIWVRTAGWPQKENGRVVRIIGNIMDITDMKEVQKALKESEQYYRNLFTEMPAAFSLHDIIFDDRGKPCDYLFLEVNPAFERLTGLKAGNVVGRRVLEILPETEPVWIERFGRVALSGKPDEFEDFSSELGKYYRVKAFSPEHGKFAVIFQDVSEEIKTRKALQACQAQLNSLENR